MQKIAWNESKIPKNSDIWNMAIIILKVEQCSFNKTKTVVCPKDANGMTNRTNTDQKAVWSQSSLFTQTCLSEHLGILRKFQIVYIFKRL